MSPFTNNLWKLFLKNAASNGASSDKLQQARARPLRGLAYELRFTVYGEPGFCAFLRVQKPIKADNSTYSVASLRKLVNAPPSHNPLMRNKTWQRTMLSRTMKRLQTATTTYIYNGPEGILVGC
jgi:hypothetical protein